MIPSRRPRRGDNPGICLAGGAIGTLLALSVGAALAIDDGRVLLIVGVAVTASSVRVPVVVGASTGALAWGLYTGFVVHRYGELSFGPADLARAVLLVTAGAAVAAVTRYARSPSLRQQELPHGRSRVRPADRRVLRGGGTGSQGS